MSFRLLLHALCEKHVCQLIILTKANLGVISQGLYLYNNRIDTFEFEKKREILLYFLSMLTNGMSS